MAEGEEVVVSFSLGVHEIVVSRAECGALSLWLDDCLRKRRGSGDGPAYLWTNVELPFEDHHLVEVRRAASSPETLDVRVNGIPLPRCSDPC